MNKDTLINLRINSELKNAFQNVISAEGFTMSEVVEACMLDIVNRGHLPINIKGRLKPKPQQILSIAFIKNCIDEIMAKVENSKIKTASIFGSYAKGTATPSSDIDIYVQTDADFSLFDLTSLQLQLEKVLGKEVDLITDNDNEYFMNHIKRERIQLYERRA